MKFNREAWVLRFNNLFSGANQNIIIEQVRNCLEARVFTSNPEKRFLDKEQILLKELIIENLGLDICNKLYETHNSDQDCQTIGCSIEPLHSD